jgi:hypothetical protein
VGFKNDWEIILKKDRNRISAAVRPATTDGIIILKSSAIVSISVKIISRIIQQIKGRAVTKNTQTPNLETGVISDFLINQKIIQAAISRGMEKNNE